MGFKRIMLRNVVKSNEKKVPFLLFFLKDDEDQSVEVEEVGEVDFETVKRRLEEGESVFIAPKRKQELNTSSIAKEDGAKPWYFTHM